jgi:hypothetical protein
MANDARWDPDCDHRGGNGFSHHRAGSNNRVRPYIRHDDGCIADPHGRADPNEGSAAFLFACGRVRLSGSMCMPSARHVHARAEQRVVLDVYEPEVASGADVNTVFDPGAGL